MSNKCHLHYCKWPLTASDQHKQDCPFWTKNSLPKKLKLVDGCIPANTECPAMKDNLCGFAPGCRHQGEKHTVPFSCGMLRFWMHTTEGRKRVERPEG